MISDPAHSQGKAPSRLVLASASPRRKKLLADYGYDALVVPASVEESSDSWLTVRERVLLNAIRKSAAVHPWTSGAVTLGVDTLVSLDGEALGKPVNLVAAAEMVARLCGRTHQVFSGVALRRPDGVFFSFVEESQVTFLPLSAAQVSAYHTLVNPLDKAGGYAAQEGAEQIIAGLEGSWTNVIGLPMERLTDVLATKFGIFPTSRTGVS